MEDQNSDDMDSLFEGMVLFTPQMVDNNEPDSHLDVRSMKDGDEVGVSSTPSPSSQPLDENLFSDLTVVAPTHNDGSEMQIQSEPSALMTSSVMKTEKEATVAAPIFRQPSRKKKRAGLRVGYGRDSQVDSEPLPNLPHSSSAVESSFSLSISTDTRRAEEEDEQGVLPSVANQSKVVGSLSTEHKNELGVGDSMTTVESHSDSVKGDEHTNSTEDTNITSLNTESMGISPKQTKEEEVSSSHSVNARYDLVKAQVNEKLKRAKDQASLISVAKKDSRRRRRKAAEDVELATVMHKEIEKKLEEACEAEDFEMAERLSESLAAAEKEKEDLLNKLRDAESECDDVDSKMQEVLELQIAAEEDCVSLLQQFSSDALINADLVVEDAEVNFSKQQNEWFMSVEAAEAKKWELEIESKLIDEGRSTLNDSIGNLVEDDVKEKDVLCERKKSLAQELEKLLSLVREKEAEIAENDSKIEAVDKRMVQAGSCFKDVQTALDANVDKLQSLLSQIESERESLWKKKDEIDNLFSVGKRRGEEMKELAMDAAAEANMYQENLGLRKALVCSVLKGREEKLSLAKKEETILADVQMLKQEISSARASLQELSSKKSSTQQECTTLKQRLLFIDRRLPELEAEKKVAAAARNFKEAARIASDSRSLTSERETQQLNMEESMLVLGKLDEEINDTTSKLQEFEELILSKEKEAALARFQRLCLISAAALSERSAALELGDVEEANVLFAEAEAADSEAKQLQLMHDICEEEFESLSKQFISMELVSSLDRKKLEELAAGC